MKEFVLKIAQSGFAAGKVFFVDSADEMHAAAKKTVFVFGSPTTEAAKSSSEDIASTYNTSLREEQEVYDIGRELARFEKAVRCLDQNLSAAAEKADAKSEAIFEAERMILKDPIYAGKIKELIRENGMDAVSAVETTGRAAAQEIAESKSLYIRQRSDDVKGLTQRLLGILRGEEERVLTTPAILVAKELSPVELSGMDPALILGIVTEKGAPASHVSILAGNLGVPYVYGSADAVTAARSSERVILEEGKLITDPGDEIYRAALFRLEERKKELQERRTLNTEGRRTKVYANIAGPEDIETLIASGAEGVGLFRSEFLFLDHEGAPLEEEQFQAYSSVAKAMDGKETVIRTMDLGSDKQADWLIMPEEKNPALGCRGLRLSLKKRELFKTQLRALLRAAAFGNVKIMVPMVTSVREVEAVRACIEECAGELSDEGIKYEMPSLGIMVETPAAVMIAEELAEKADFFSIGTNDLTQYALALDREAQGLDEYYDPCHEAVMRLIEMTVTAGHKRDIPVSICGELAGNPQAVKRLVAAGVDELSVSASRVLETKLHVIEAEKQLLHEKESSKSTESEGSVAAPADGKLIPMEEIPDPVFSSGTLGECVGILPENGTIYAPCDGTVSGVAKTGHAITFTASDGRQILVHVGIDTVSLGGRGFRVHVKEGMAVSKGDIVLEADLEVIRVAGLSPIVVTVCLKQ